MSNGFVSEVKLSNAPWNAMDNSIGTEGAIALAEALKVNSAVTRIDLMFNSIGAEGAIALAEALKVTSTVIGIVLRGNFVDYETSQLIKRISNNRIRF
ncbi:hypothetical protein GEMRC1_012303 [Eukaryota sp. GEM-RC1]